jgi:hypothetical protein
MPQEFHTIRGKPPNVDAITTADASDDSRGLSLFRRDGV